MTNQSAIEKSAPTTVETRQRPRASGWTYRPIVDIYDTPEEVLVVADLPGSSLDQIDVSVEAGLLTIHAGIAPRTCSGRPILQEYGVGDFHRRFEIDDSVDPEGIKAEYRGGVLTIHLPKAQRARRRRIPISG